MILSRYPTNLYTKVYQDDTRYIEVSYQDVLKFKMHITETTYTYTAEDYNGTRKSSESPVPSAS